MIIDVEGIVLNSRSYGDSSKILDIFTPNYGIIGVIAKGCKSMKSSLRSFTDKLTYANFVIYYKKDKLSILSEANSIDNFSKIKNDIERISSANFILDLVNQVYKQNPSDELYDLLISCLKKINESFNPLVIINILELKLLDYLGIMPNLSGCTICGNKNVITLSSDKGGYLCESCRTHEPIVSKGAIKLIRMYYLVDINKISKLDLSRDVTLEVNNFIDSYYDQYSGLYLKSKQLLKNVLKIK